MRHAESMTAVYRFRLKAADPDRNRDMWLRSPGWQQTAVPELLARLRTACANVERHLYDDAEDMSTLQDVPAVWLVLGEHSCLYPFVTVTFEKRWHVHYSDLLAQLETLLPQWDVCEVPDR